MHLRQIALVARELQPVARGLRRVFGFQEGFHDSGVEEFGLHNEVFPVGTTFLEVVSPLRDGTTAGRFLERRGGDGGYMVILQTDDLDADRRRLATLGVRLVWEVTLDDIATVHLHPRDVGGAIVSLDQPRPPASWRWGGPGWEGKVRTEVVRGITSVTLEATDPPRLAARWAEVLGLGTPRAAGSARVLALAPGEIRFVPAGERGEGIGAVGLAAADGDAAVGNARAGGFRSEGRSVWIGGVRFDLE